MSRTDLTKPPAQGKMFIDVVSGREGPCLCLGDHDGGHRIAGPKPWGGGSTQHRFVIDIAEVRRELDAYADRNPGPGRGYVVAKSAVKSLGQDVYKILSNGGLVVATVNGDLEAANTLAKHLNTRKHP